ncbi:HAMP domain-containing sensor histidine kinase [Pseudonocardia bannensis]|uniref:histidine kinase n=1 Tax=Pseudonocardia bannensis TaxID=630973 RepID=A0A848DF33_9PSEU|nr:HAMP domain-containing sensor histidine kinase [Pseudonocardia bannensis]NMH91163.1 HAMP domain-containing histidine kinase [Pseudonocardia bannensis]
MARRIVWLTVLAATIAITLFGLPLAAAAERFYRADEFRELERHAYYAQADLTPALLRGTLPAVWPIEEDEDLTLALYSPDGELLRGTGPNPGNWFVSRAIAKSDVRTGVDEGDLVVTVPVMDGTDVIGVVRAATPETKPILRAAERWVLMLGLAGVALLVTWLLARRLAARLAGPLQDLSRAALRLGDGDFSIRNRPVGIAEIDSVGSSMNATAERLDALLERERAFSAEASHQLRTPLAGLRLTLEAALHAPPDQRAEAIRTSLAAADRLETTIDDLMTLAHGRRPAGEVLDVVGLLGEAQPSWQRRLEARGRTLDIAVDPDAPHVQASAAAVRQLLAVLLDNAVEHGAGRVTITVREIGDAVAIDVADQGSIPAGRTAQLFRRRLPDEDGHGIGLALARRLAEAEGGRLQLTSSDATKFTVLLPAVPEQGDRAGDQDASAIAERPSVSP